MYTYSDMNSQVKIGSTGTVDLVYDAEAVLQSIKSIIATVSGERVRNPIGTRIVRLLFQPMTRDLTEQLRSEIIDVVNRFEPRAEIVSFSLDSNYDGNYYDAIFVLRIKNIRENQTVRTRLRSFAA